MIEISECEYEHLKYQSKVWRRDCYELIEIITNTPDEQLKTLKKALIVMNKWKEYENENNTSEVKGLSEILERL